MNMAADRMAEPNAETALCSQRSRRLDSLCWPAKHRVASAGTPLHPLVALKEWCEGLAGGPLPGWQELLQHSRRQTFRRGALIFCQGELSSYLYLVCQGVVSLRYLAPDGSHCIKSFVAEGGLFSGRLGITAGPADVAAEAIEATECESINRALLDRLVFEHPRWQVLLMKAVDLYFDRMHEREQRLRTLSVENRLLLCLRETPDLAARVPQKDLACYLGISAAALSRIRRRLGLIADPLPVAQPLDE